MGNRLDTLIRLTVGRLEAYTHGASAEGKNEDQAVYVGPEAQW